MLKNDDCQNIFKIISDLNHLPCSESKHSVIKDNESITCFNESDYFRSSSLDYFRNSSVNEIDSVLGDGDHSEPMKSRKLRSKNNFQNKDFVFLSTIGNGAYAQVIKAKHVKTNEIYAIKILDKKILDKEEKLYQIFLENEFLNMCTHQNIVKIYGAYEDSNNVYLVLEYGNKGDLAEFIMNNAPLSLEEGQIIIAQIVNCLEYLWSMKIIHRDIKPENFLIGQLFELKLIDFATAAFCGKVLDEDNLTFVDEEDFVSSQYETFKDCRYSHSTQKLDTLIPENVEISGSSSQNPFEKSPMVQKRSEIVKKQRFVGTAEYMSPEVINNEPIGAYTDLWSLGCIIYYIFTGQNPFQEKTEYLTFQRILSLKFHDSPNNSAIPQTASDLIDSLLKINPQERIGYMDGKYNYCFEELKNHKFFQNFDKTSYINIINGMVGKTKTEKKQTIQLSERSLSEMRKEQMGRSAKLVLAYSENVDEVPLKAGILKKRSPYFFYNKRKVILYSTPRIDYIDPEKNMLKGSILLDLTCRAEQVGKSQFILKTPKRNFVFICKPKYDISPWVIAINDAIIKYSQH